MSVPLANADLRGGGFTASNLSGANLKGARLDEANLESANLNKTNLSATSLTAVKGLTPQQLETAIMDAATQLPEHLATTRRANTQAK